MSSLVRTDFVLDALEQTLHSRHRHNDDTLIRRSDCGGQYVSIRYTEHITEVDVEPSVGRVAPPDNAP